MAVITNRGRTANANRNLKENTNLLLEVLNNQLGKIESANLLLKVRSSLLLVVALSVDLVDPHEARKVNVNVRYDEPSDLLL